MIERGTGYGGCVQRDATRGTNNEIKRLNAANYYFTFTKGLRDLGGFRPFGRSVEREV